MNSRIMYIERKGDGISGPARIGRVTFSKSGRSLYYQGRRFQTLSGSGFKANYFDCESGEHYWFSGCKKRGGDRLYAGTIPMIESTALLDFFPLRFSCLFFPLAQRVSEKCRSRIAQERRSPAPSTRGIPCFVPPQAFL